jgi:hypothetical protein
VALPKLPESKRDLALENALARRIADGGTDGEEAQLVLNDYWLEKGVLGERSFLVRDRLSGETAAYAVKKIRGLCGFDLDGCEILERVAVSIAVREPAEILKTDKWGRARLVKVGDAGLSDAALRVLSSFTADTMYDVAKLHRWRIMDIGKASKKVLRELDAKLAEYGLRLS